MALLSRRLWMVVALVALAGLALALPFGLLRAKQAAHPGARTAQSAAKTASDGKASEVAKLNNLGVAYMNQGRFEPAQKLFEQALAADPHYALARLNLGLALLSQQKLEAARAALEEAAAKLLSDPHASYNLGLVYKDLNETDKAIAAFRHVSEIAPDEPDSFYFIGVLLTQEQKFDEAISAFQHAIALNPFHASAEFGIARAFQRKGDTNSAREHLARFQKITQDHLGSPMGAGYGDQGRFSLAEFARSAGPAAPPVIPVHFAAHSIAELTPPSAGHPTAAGPSTGACFFDFDGDGKPDLFLVSALDGGTSRLLRNLGNGKFEDDTDAAGLKLAGAGLGCAAGDFDNDSKTDLAVCLADGVRLLHNEGNGKFADVTQAAGIRREKGCVSLTFVDYDHDGDLDLYIVNAPGGNAHNVLWRNNANGTFTDVSAETALGIPATGAGVVTSDFNNDRAIDFVIAGETNSGGELRLLRNLGPAGWADVTKDVKLDAVKLHQPRAVAVADLDGDGAADLVVTQTEGMPAVLRNEGGNQRNWLRIDLKALNDNKSAIGTKVELYAGPLYQKWEVQGASGYLGQNAMPILAGLGSEKEAQAVRLLWPTGVPQDEIKLAARATQKIEELDRRGSSCPILFAWNGREYEFIADMIGPGVVGHWVDPGERDVADPTEYLKVSERIARPRGGLLSFRFMEPMEETVYLDQVRLRAIDHPAAIEVNPNERFVSNPPFPEFRVIASRNTRPPAGASDDRGKDVLPLLAKRDRKYVTEFESLPFAGFAKLHWIELDLGAWRADRPLRLLLDGYTDYFTATSMYAADQAGIKVIPPYVEAQDANGKWRRVVDDMGFPAGLERTMVADLSGKIPPGVRRIRIVTNLKIYWDAVRIDQTPDTKDIRVTEVPLVGAALDFLGYPREIRGTPASDTWYSFSNRSPTGPYARAAGNYTRYGDVKDLLRAPDDRFAVFGSGEGVKLDFDPGRLPALPAGWTRDYFFFADGYEKDLDFYAAHAFTVEPLPYHTGLAYPYREGQEYPVDAIHLRYELEYNTRQRSGKLPASLRYDYRNAGAPKN